MATTTPENAESWRELIDQLTPEQITELELEERTGAPAGSLRFQARSYATAALGDVLLGDVEDPADANNVYGWETRSFDDGRWSRVFDGTVRSVGNYEVRIQGVQCADGTVTREVNVDDEFLSPTGARELAAELTQRASALIAAAREIEGWAAR